VLVTLLPFGPVCVVVRTTPLPVAWTDVLELDWLPFGPVVVLERVYVFVAWS
jgi:hypothetical protein